MKPERYRQVVELFHRVRALPEAERGVFLERECKGDGSLRNDVNRMLMKATEASREGMFDAPEPASGGNPDPPEDRGGDVDRHRAETADWRRSPDPRPSRPDSAQADPTCIGRFEIVALIGQGTFGRVYRAQDPRLGRIVALKVPVDGTFATAEERERFIREGRLAARVRHKNICPIHEVDEEDGQPYIVMGYIPGWSLASYLRRLKQPLNDKQVAVIVRKLALALAKAHEAGVVHRDLKPSNILYDNEHKELVITDFGLARALGGTGAQSTRSGVIVGTPAYMAPEQARDAKAASPSSDIFSLGVIFYELLTGGQRPFVGQTSLEILSQVLSAAPVPPRSVRESIAPALEAACLRALEKDPAKRFASMGQLADAMSAFLQNQAADRPVEPASDLTGTGESAGKEPPKSGSFDDRSEFRRIEALFGEIAAKNQVETVAVVEAAVARQRIAPWKLLLAGVVSLGLIAATVQAVLPKTGPSLARALVLISEFVPPGTTNRPNVRVFIDNVLVRRDQLDKPISLSPGFHYVTIIEDDKVILERRLKVTEAGQSESPVDLTERPKEGPSKEQLDNDGTTSVTQAPTRHETSEETADRVPEVTHPLPKAIPSTEKATDVGAQSVTQAPPTPPSLPPPPRPETPEEAADRKFAGWLGEHKATCTIVHGTSSPEPLNPAEGIPAEPFRVIDVDTSNRRTITGANIDPLIDWLRRRETRSYTFGSTTVGAEGTAKLKRVSSLRELSFINFCDIDNAALKALANEELTKLDFWAEKFDDDGLATIARFKKLEEFGPRACNVTRRGLSHLTGLKRLKRLNLWGTHLRGVDLKQLAELPIEVLTLGIREVGDEDLAALPAFPLTDLHLSTTQVTSQGLKQLDRFPKLQSLNLDGAIRVEDLAALPVLPLTELRLEETQVTAQGLKPLDRFPRLKRLYLKKASRVTDDAVDTLTRLKSLTDLDVSETEISDEGLERLRTALSRPGFKLNPEDRFLRNRQAAEWAIGPKVAGSVRIAPLSGPDDVAYSKGGQIADEPFKLVGLTLTGKVGENWTNSDLSRLRLLKSVRSIALSADDISDQTLDRLAPLTSVESLTLTGRNVRVTAAGLKALLGWPRLKVLDLGSVTLSDAELEVLAQMRSLEELKGLSGAGLTDTGLARLAALPALRVLDGPGVAPGPKALPALRGSRIRQAAFTQVTDATLGSLVDGLPQLSVLTLADGRVSDAGLQPLALLTDLTQLALPNAPIKGNGLFALVPLRRLTRLDLTGATIDDTAAGALRTMSGLVSLSLAKTRIGNTGLATVGQIAQLKELDLGETAVTDEGLVSLVGHRRLRRLGLAGTRITDAAVPRLSKIQPLLRIDLSGTAVTPQGREALRKSLPHCRILPVEPNRCEFEALSLERVGNKALQDKMYSLQSLPIGVQRIEGVEYRIGSKLIQLGSSTPEVQSEPERISVSIPTLAANRLHILHAEHFVDNVAEIGAYVVHFEDGRELTIPVVKGENVWNFEVSNPSGIPQAVHLGWTGTFPAPERQQVRPALYHLEWENPYPDVPIREIELISRKGKTGQALFCVAITMER